MDAQPRTTYCKGAPDLVAGQSVKNQRFAKLAAHLATFGFDLHHTSWGIHIVASGVQSGWLATACRLASVASEVAR